MECFSQKNIIFAPSLGRFVRKPLAKKCFSLNQCSWRNHQIKSNALLKVLGISTPLFCIFKGICMPNVYASRCGSVFSTLSIVVQVFGDTFQLVEKME